MEGRSAMACAPHSGPTWLTCIWLWMETGRNPYRHWKNTLHKKDSTKIKLGIFLLRGKASDVRKTRNILWSHVSSLMMCKCYASVYVPFLRIDGVFYSVCTSEDLLCSIKIVYSHHLSGRLFNFLKPVGVSVRVDVSPYWMSCFPWTTIPGVYKCRSW